MSKQLLFCLLVVCFATSSAHAAWDLGKVWSSIEEVAQKVADNISSAGNTVLTTVGSPIIWQCNNVKSMMGLTYSKMDGSEKEPDFAELTLDFNCGGISKRYNLTTAADEIMTDHYFNASQKLYVFVHGFMSSTSSESATAIREALKATGNVNILALDSSKYLKWLYLSQSTYVIFIGERFAQVLAALYEDGLDPKNMHIIGHSLGAQISSYAGKTFHNLTGTKIGRISGLDVAGPCYSELEGDDFHLNANDADFVDVVHSNIRLLGLADAIGHVDYYPNGGHYQPGCSAWPACSHSRSVQLFAESIVNPEAFAAVKCDNWDDFRDGKCAGGEVAYMGFGATPDHTGTFYLQTDGESSYGLGIDGVTYKD